VQNDNCIAENERSFINQPKEGGQRAMARSFFISAKTAAPN